MWGNIQQISLAPLILTPGVSELDAWNATSETFVYFSASPEVQSSSPRLVRPGVERCDRRASRRAARSHNRLAISIAPPWDVKGVRLRKRDAARGERASL